MKHGWRRAIAALTAAALLAALTGRALAADAGAPTLRQQMEAVQNAVPDLVTAAGSGDREQFRRAYDRFAEALDPVLPAVRAEDPGLAARMAGASSTIRWLLLNGILSEEDIAREVAVIRDALAEAIQTMAQAPEPAQRITVVAREYRFRPDNLRVKAGAPVRVRLENRGRVPHEFRIPELNVVIGPVEPGQSAEGTFTVERAGTYSYECHVDGHHLKGMRGRLVVR